jgi:hypothetical protein
MTFLNNQALKEHLMSLFSKKGLSPKIGLKCD